MKKGRKTVSVKWTILKFLLLCWLLPMLLIIGVIGRYLLSNHFEQAADSYVRQLEYNNQLCVERLNGAVEDSREASYDTAILNAVSGYRSGSMSQVEAYRDCERYLKRNYQRNSAFAATILWDSSAAEDFSCSVYNETAGGLYQDIRTYWEQDHAAVAEKAAEIGTMVGFVRCADRLYLVRNMVNSSYKPMAVLVMRLSRFYCFGNLENVPMAGGLKLEINGEAFVEAKARQPESMEHVIVQTAEKQKGYLWEKGQIYVYQKTRGNGYSLRTILEIDGEAALMPFYGWQYVFAGMLLALVPLVLFFMYQFRRRVSDPVEELMQGFAEMEKENLGYQLAFESRNLEFQYLKDSFNQMSAQMKHYFNRIFTEEIALKDARIMALQSHINPHFMNNTLEIINWEARLGGNEKVSKMIEALATLLDAAIDRKKRPEVRLAEEMMCVNSYLYITKERLGKRLTVEIDLPEELMDFQVPRLILQPLIENAIEHGVARRSSGRVSISGRKEGEFLVLEIVNDGTLTPEAEEQIRRLLSEDYDTSREPSGNLGIANVNQRLRILYGPPCGLVMEKRGEDAVAAVIRIRLSGNEEFLV